MVFTAFEIMDMVLMTLIVGYLFKDVFRIPRKQPHDVLEYYQQFSHRNVKWENFWFACALIAPAIIVHELGHKFSAMAFGLDATFHAACSTSNLFMGGSFFNFACNLQLLAVVLVTLGFGFVIFVPAFVSISGNALAWQNAIIAFAGPAVHLVFWLVSAYMLKQPSAKHWTQRKRMFVYFFKQINMILFFFNMLPIPPFDGWHFFSSLFGMIF